LIWPNGLQLKFETDCLYDVFLLIQINIKWGGRCLCQHV